MKSLTKMIHPKVYIISSGSLMCLFKYFIIPNVCILFLPVKVIQGILRLGKHKPPKQLCY